MSEFEDDIWRMFAQETEEHLETIESLLLSAEAGNLAEGDIAVLFRAFHSIKGLCRAMDLIGMESVAHLAEDLLGLAREGACPLDSAMAALLIEAQDALKVLRGATLDGAGPGTAPAELLARLGAMHARLTGQPASASLAEPAKAIPAPEAASLGDASAGGKDSATQRPHLHDDNEMLRYYTDLLKQNLPAVGMVLSDQCAPSPENCASCQGCHNLDNALDTLALASDAMNFSNIGEALSGLQRIKIAGTSFDTVTRERFLAAAPGLLSLLHHVETETEGDSGVKDLALNMSASVHAVLEGELWSIGRDLDEFENGEGNLGIDDEALAESLFGRLSRAASYFAFLCPQHQSPLLLLLEDVFARAARREMQIYGDLIEITRDSLAVINRVHTLLRTGSPIDADLTQRETALASRIHDYTWSNSAGDSPLTAIKDFITGLNIDAELTEILTPENVRDLMEGVRKGEMIYEILAHLESDEQLAVDFLGWIEKRGRVITNRTVFIDGRTWYEMLFLSGTAREVLASEITGIDGQRQLVRLRMAEGDATVASVITPGTPAAAVAPTAAAGTSRTGAATESSSAIRVPGETLDRFMIQIGEMVLVRGRLSHAIGDNAARNALYTLKRLTDSGALDAETQTALRTAFDALDSQRRRLEESDTLIQSALSRLQVNAMELRVVPVDTVFKRFPRVVRDIAQLQGKRIRLEVSGQEVRIDKAMIEVLADPLLHMVRNAADHGVETPEEREAKGKHPEATLTLSAMQRGNRVVVQVTDDGRGIDTGRVLAKAVERGIVRPEDASRMSDDDIFQLLFAPGFSTAEKVTETSGRGVGMDVVRNNVMRLGGAVKIESIFGQGSTFTLTMPLSAAVQEVLLVESGSQVLALPARYVEEVIEVERADAQSIKGRAAILLRGAFLPLAHIADLLGFARQSAVGGSRVAVVLGNGQHTLGLLVDRILGRQELFIKDIHPRLMALPGVGGASILGDGRPVLILDGEGLLRLAEKVEPRALEALLAA